jgi:hypothetical protein
MTTKTLAKTIELWQLKKLKACDSHVEIFFDTFGQTAELTLENCIKGVKVGLDLDWFAHKVFTAPALEQYRTFKATALEQYETVKATALEQYETVKAPAWEQYETVKATALEQYETVKATAFFEIYLVQLESKVNT